ncbi:peptidoglycan-binding protein [Streptomyces sp. S1]|uniref:peptidoglycan-binding protein n=1 Tax=Streptomyces sp. S1 TaxID=718288 RepID=UPI003D757986
MTADQVPAAQGLVRRRRALLAVVIGCLVCTGVGAGAATLIKSPAQVAVEAAPPQPDVLTAPVVRKVLAQSVVTRGKVIPSHRFEVKSAGSPKDVGRSVITDIRVKPGQKLSYGQVLVEISGRPIFLLKGDIPAYRDLIPGMQGRDVAQLQDALAGIGYSLGADRSGFFGSGTEKAVNRFYRSIGYSPVTTDRPVNPPVADKEVASPGNGTPSGDKNNAIESKVESISVVPLAEIAFVKADSVRVDTVEAKVGSEPSEVLLSLASGSLTINGAVASYEKGLIRPGQDVQILSEISGERAVGKVVSVANSPSKRQEGESALTGESYAVVIEPVKGVSAEFSGADVRLTIVAASSQGEVLAVPSSAISAGADGLMSVTVRDGGQERRVPVRVGMTGDGFVQISSDGPARIAQGDQVVVGTQMPSSKGK